MYAQEAIVSKYNWSYCDFTLSLYAILSSSAIYQSGFLIRSTIHMRVNNNPVCGDTRSLPIPTAAPAPLPPYALTLLAASGRPSTSVSSFPVEPPLYTVPSKSVTSSPSVVQLNVPVCLNLSRSTFATTDSSITIHGKRTGL